MVIQKEIDSIVHGLGSVWTSHQVTIIDFPNATYRWSSHSQSAVAVASTTLMPWAATATTPLATLKRNCLWSFCLCTVKFIASKTKFVQVIAFVCFCISQFCFIAWVLLSIEQKKIGRNPKCDHNWKKNRIEKELNKKWKRIENELEKKLEKKNERKMSNRKRK